MAKKGLERYEMIMEFMFLFLFIINLSACRGFEVELELLLAMKASISDHSHALSSWNSSVSFCKWNGITCFDSSHVSKIELPGTNLSGRIPESIFRLPNIQSIDLSSNQLSGEIPRNLSSCFSLRYLNLSSNNLTGLIPSAHLPVLETLDLSNNMLSGEIPEDIGLFSGLKVLDFGGNVLSGRIPDSVTNMTMLEFLTLASNQLTGEIPRKLGLMKSLGWIYLGYNNFSGEIPKEIGELISLKHLDLVYNNLTGEIPSSLGNLINLEYLFLYFNKLTGPIPKPIFNLKKLVSLDLSDNSLSGEIPELFSKLQNLEILHLFSNNFSGKIPNALSSLPHLQVLQLWSNRLSGEIPRDLGKEFESLQESTASSTSEKQALWRTFTRIHNAAAGLFLDISSNNLSGRIDDRKWDMPQLQMLNLASNNFFGLVPGSFGSKKVENLDLSGNNFSGSIPQSFGEFSELMELKLSENELSGQIPDQLSYCKKLVTLDLSHNHLTGEIPTSLSAMPVLGQLDLSVNELTGTIPANLGNVESLVQVNISHNHFHGSLPSTGAFLAINSSAVTGNKLCGGEKTSGLPPCNGVKNHARWFVLTFLLAFLMMFAIIVFFSIFVRQRKGSELKRVESDKDGTWELQFLNSRASKSITVKDIVTSLREENLVASGKTGLSYKGKSASNNKQFLAKKVASISTSCWMDWTQLCKVNHPNIVKLLATCRSGKAAILVYEYIEGKHLSEVIQGLSWERRLKVAIGIARALKYLHCYCSPSIVVGDITPRKIMVDEKDEAHLRLSLPGINYLSSDSKCFNSSAYVAPETKGSSKGLTTEKSDIYGFGLLLIELLTGKSAADPELGIHGSLVEWARYCYSDCHLEMWVDTALTKNNNQVVLNQIVETMNLGLQCTAGDPAARPCAIELVKSLESVVRSGGCVSSGLKLFSVGLY
ncbi:UNVERIFIED_CONTAM: putative inactive leucine-rich repeat receptor-like protein kinase [Sesamum calycinum]|uniref:Inactive leucine-rich repeat receptor-like protein kinase n=1 Tax=Sesamum calycinum TaxID=2727403 RepID=A0AAW2M092_9LAMI